MQRVILVLLSILLLVALCLVLTLWWTPILIHLSQETGTSDSSSRAYDFWSGFGSDIGEIALIGGVWMGVRKINCHDKGCPRIGHYEVMGTPYKVCRKHHPTMNGERITAEHVAAAHDNAD